MRKKQLLSSTPRKKSHARKVYFSIAMREKISKNWVKIRKGMVKKSRE